MTWAPDYVTSAQLKQYMRINDSVDDTQIGIAITAASRAIDQATGRQFGQLAAATEWVYTPEYYRHLTRWVIHTDDLPTTTGLVVEVDGTALAAADYQPEPRQAVAKGKVWTQLVLAEGQTCSGERDSAAITASWGWAAVPTAVVQACLLQASRFLSRRDSPYGIAGSPDSGSEMRLLATVDPDVRVALGPYVRRWGVV